MRSVAGQAVQVVPRDRMAGVGMAFGGASRNGKDPHAHQIGGGNRHGTTEELHFSWVLKPGRVLAAVAFETEVVHVQPKPLRTLSGMLGVADQTALLERRSVEEGLFDPRLCQIGVASQAELDGIAPGLMGKGTGMRTVTGQAIACDHRGVLRFCFVETLLHIRVAGQAQLAARPFDQHDLALLRCGVARVALFFRKRQVREIVDELRAVGTVGIVAFRTTGNSKWLACVRRLNGGILRVEAIQAEGRIGLGQVEDSVGVAGRFSLVYDMAGGATQVDSSMWDCLANLSGNLFVAAETEVIRGLPSLSGAAQQMSVGARVRVVTINTLSASNGPVKTSLRGLRSLVFMTGEAQFVGLCCQPNKRLFFVFLNRVAGVAPSLNGGMHNLI